MMQADDIAESIRYAVTQGPDGWPINEILVRPTEQER